MEETDNICFVCDQTIPLEKWKYQLQVTATKRRNAPVAHLIQDLVGDEFEVLVGERDAICSKCMNLLNLMDSLTFQLEEVKSTLSQLLHAKYNLAAEDTQLHVEYDDSTHEEREPLYQCDICDYQTKYEKEFNMHLRKHPVSKARKSPVAIKPEASKEVNSVSTKMPPSKITQKIRSKSTKKKSPKKSLRKKKPPKKKSKNIKKVTKEKKKKVVFQCSVCNRVFPDESEIRLHCKKDHGNDKIVVSDEEEEYEDVQTLDSSDNEAPLPKKNQNKKMSKSKKVSTKTKLDFLDDWVEDEDNDDLHSPAKKLKPNESENETTSKKHTLMKNIFRSSLRESFDDVNEDDMDEKDTSSQPTCMFCQAKFSSFEAVQDHIKLTHGSRSLPTTQSKQLSATPGSEASFEIDSTTDITEIKNQANVTKPKSKAKSYKCNHCGIKKVSLKFIKGHVKTHKRNMSLQCRKCGIIFKRFISLKVHTYKCRKVGSVFIKCKQCRFKFVNVNQLKNHIRKVHLAQRSKKQDNSRCKKSSSVHKKSISADGNLGVTKSPDLNQINPVKKSSAKMDNSKISVSEVSSTSIETEVKQKEKGVTLNQYHCIECKIDFPKPSQFQTHRLRHIAHTCNSLGICVYCEKLFFSSEHLAIHVKRVHDNLHIAKPKCTVCNKEYSLAKDLKLHYLRCHFSEKAEKFMKQVSESKNKGDTSKLKTNDENDVYNKVFKELQDLTGEGNDSDDLSLNEGNVSSFIYNCPVCDFASQNYEEVKTHLPSHVQDYCNICENIFRPDEVIKHIENHSIDFQGLKCSVCDRECHDEIHIQAHTQSFHSEPKQSLLIHRKHQFQCNMCKKSCFTEKSLLSHKASQHGDKTKKVLSCSECKTDFFSEKTYQTHIEFAHRSGLNCKYCDKSQDNIKKLIFHENNHLKEVKSIIKCNICGKVLKSKQALKTHKSLHSSVNSKCQVCNQSFKSYHSLREHSAKHSGLQEKKYFCEICGKGFYFYDSHTRHRRLHLDPLLFKCKTCKERFQTKLKLMEHKETCNTNKVS